MISSIFGAWLSLVERPLWERNQAEKANKIGRAIFSAILRQFRSFPANLRHRRGAAATLTLHDMKRIALALVFTAAGCSSPTAPSSTNPPVVPVSALPTTPPAVPTTPAPTTPSTPSTPAPAAPTVVFPPNDSRFNLAFYRMLAHNALHGPVQPLRRQSQAPWIYLRTVMDTGAPIDSTTLNMTEAALANVAGSLTGVFGLTGLERGTGTRRGQRGWITVEWLADTSQPVCGRAGIAGDYIWLYPNVRGCRCAGNPAIIDMATVKHELGHALGFWHTDGRDDLMYDGNEGQCDLNPSAREIYHAAVAYTRPIGSAAP